MVAAMENGVLVGLHVGEIVDVLAGWLHSSVFVERYMSSACSDASSADGVTVIGLRIWS